VKLRNRYLKVEGRDLVVLWKECNDPLLYLERRAYFGAIRDALAGVEEAQVVLAKARQRLELDRATAVDSRERRHPVPYLDEPPAYLISAWCLSHSDERAVAWRVRRSAGAVGSLPAAALRGSVWFGDYLTRRHQSA
jgi:hypothetical protein